MRLRKCENLEKKPVVGNNHVGIAILKYCVANTTVLLRLVERESVISIESMTRILKLIFNKCDASWTYFNTFRGPEFLEKHGT